MAKEKIFKIVIAQPEKNRYHESVLPYIYENFSFERAIEVDEINRYLYTNNIYK